MERDPLHILAQNQTGHHHEFPKFRHVYTQLVEFGEINSRSLQQFNTVVCADVIIRMEFKVELPASAAFCPIAFPICEREAQLDYFQHVHVDSQRLVPDVRGCNKNKEAAGGGGAVSIPSPKVRNTRRCIRMHIHLHTELTAKISHGARDDPRKLCIHRHVRVVL